MKFGTIGPVPWDMVVFLTLTSLGFGYSVQKVMNPEREIAGASTRADPTDISPTVDLGCLERRLKESLSADNGSVKLRGRFCAAPSAREDRVAGVRVKNLSTGMEGTVFFRPRDASFVTDLMPLRSGKNIIQIEWTAENGQRPRQYLAEVWEH